MSDNTNNNGAFENRVNDMKDAIREKRWNDISSQVWGDTEAQKALSQAARSGQAEGLPKVTFTKNDEGSLVLEFDTNTSLMNRSHPQIVMNSGSDR